MYVSNTIKHKYVNRVPSFILYLNNYVSWNNVANNKTYHVLIPSTFVTKISQDVADYSLKRNIHADYVILIITVVYTLFL